jgi:hypothetical protein
LIEKVSTIESGIEFTSMSKNRAVRSARIGIFRIREVLPETRPPCDPFLAVFRINHQSAKTQRPAYGVSVPVNHSFHLLLAYKLEFE